MLADACHQIASYLYSLDDGVHKHSLYYTWRDSTEPASSDPRLVLHRAPAAFYHTSYQDFDRYPNGIADVVGYWAEAKIFGGVMVFDRGESGTEVSVGLKDDGRSNPLLIKSPTVSRCLLAQLLYKRAGNYLSTHPAAEPHPHQLSPWIRHPGYILPIPHPRNQREPVAMGSLRLHDQIQHFPRPLRAEATSIIHKRCLPPQSRGLARDWGRNGLRCEAVSRGAGGRAF